MRFVEVKVVAEAETAITMADERVIEGGGGGLEWERIREDVCLLSLLG